jgi:hypothetical protein
MKDLLEQLLLLPRRVRQHMMAAFALMAVIPILAGAYAVTVYLGDRKTAAMMSGVLLVCVLLAMLGFLVMRATIWSVIDIADTVDRLIPSDGERPQSRDEAEELVRFERLIIYMENQIHTARRRIKAYRDVALDSSVFRLPRLIPRQALRERLDEELRVAEHQRYPITLLCIESPYLPSDMDADDSKMPDWLVQMFRASKVMFDGLGVLDNSRWVGWMVKRNRLETSETVASLQTSIPPDREGKVSIRVVSHPADGLPREQVIASLAQPGSDS